MIFSRVKQLLQYNQGATLAGHTRFHELKIIVNLKSEILLINDFMGFEALAVS